MLLSMLHGMAISLALVISFLSVFDTVASAPATHNITIDPVINLLRDQSTLITCNIKELEDSMTAILTCMYPFNIRHAKIGISVQTSIKGNKAQDSSLVLHCFWFESKKLTCTKKDKYVFLDDDDVQSKAALQIPVEEAFLYYFTCQASEGDYVTDKCSLERKYIPSTAEESTPRPKEESSPDTSLIIGIVIGLCFLLLIIFLFLRFRKKLIEIITCKKDGRAKSVSPPQNSHIKQDEETKPFIPDDIVKDSLEHKGCTGLENSQNKLCLDGTKSASSETTSKEGHFLTSPLRKIPCERNRPISLQCQIENRKLWIKKQYTRLSSWGKSTPVEEEHKIDQRVQKCLKLKYAIINLIDGGQETFDGDNEDLCGQNTLQELFSETKKIHDILKGVQNSIIRKKVNAAVASAVQKDMDRLQVIDNFIALAGKQINDMLSKEEKSEDNEIHVYMVKLKTVTELEMLLEHHESCLKKSSEHLTLSRKAEYEKRQLELGTLREKFFDLKTMFENNIEQALKNNALRHSSEKTSTETLEQLDTQPQDCLPVTRSIIPSPKLDMETKADNEQIGTLDQQFPDIETGNFVIPAKHIKHVHTTSTLIGSEQVNVFDDPTTSQHSTRRHINDLEDVQEKLHKCLSEVMTTTARSDAMMAITQTNFDLYDKQAIGLPDTAVDENNPDNILKLKKTFSHLMIVNKQRGILGGIVQSVHLTDPVKVEQELTDSVSKLKDAERIIREGIKTIPKADDVAVRMMLILPNISKKQLDGKLALQKAVQNVHCLYKDDIDSEKDPREWWDASWLPRQSDTMSINLYKNLVARFALPAIRVHNSLYKLDHTSQSKVGDTAGDDLQTERQQSPLRPDQEKLLDFDAMDEAQDDVKCLHGTEGPAMTKLLYLRAQQWMSHFMAVIIFLLQTTDDRTSGLPDSTHLQTAHGTFKHVDISNLYSKKPDDGTVVLKEEGKETLLAALGLSSPGHSHTAIHIVADKADGDVVAAVFEWLKSQHVKTVRMWAAGKDAPRNNEDGRLAVHHIK